MLFVKGKDKCFLKQINKVYKHIDRDQMSVAGWYVVPQTCLRYLQLFSVLQRTSEGSFFDPWISEKWLGRLCQVGAPCTQPTAYHFYHRGSAPNACSSHTCSMEAPCWIPWGSRGQGSQQCEDLHSKEQGSSRVQCGSSLAASAGVAGAWWNPSDKAGSAPRQLLIAG